MTFYIYATPMKSWASYVVGRQDKRAWHASTRDFLMTKMREVGLISPTGVKKLDASFSRELLLSFWHHQKLHPQDIYLGREKNDRKDNLIESIGKPFEGT